MSIKLTAENLKLVIFLALLPVFIFSVLIASKAIYVAEEIIPSVYAENELRSLKILNSNLPAETIATLRVEIADNPEERALGLSARKSLLKNRGMLFVFPEPDHYSFWMKNMNFGLDFIWISENKIVEITKNVKPEDYQPASARQSPASNQSNRGESLGGPPKVLIPKEKVNKVLEVNAGATERLNIKVGDKIELQ